MAMTRGLRWALIAFAAVVVLIAALIAGGFWFIAGEAGLKWAVGEATLRTHGKLKLEGVTGSLTGTIHVQQLTYSDDNLRLLANEVDFTWSPRALVSRSVHVDAFAAQRIALELKPSDKKSTPPDSLVLPLPIEVNSARVDQIDVASGNNHWRISGLAFRYSGNTQRHQFANLALDTPWGAMRGSVEVGATKPFPTHGNIALAGSDLLRRANATIAVGGDFTALVLGIDAGVIGASAKGSVSVAPFDPRWLRSSSLALQDVDLARIDESLPHTSLAGTVDASSEDAGRIRGRVTARNSDVGAWTAHKLPIVALAAGFAIAGDSITLDQLDGELAGGGRASGSASADAVAAQWRLALRDVDLRSLATDLRVTRLNGNIAGRIRLDTKDIEGQMTGDIRQSDLALAFDAAIRHDIVDLRSFRAQARGGSLQGAGQIALRGDQAFSVKATASRLDPAAWGDYPQASLSATVDAHGVIKPTWSVTGAFKLADGSRLRGYPLAGGGRLSLAPGRVSGADLDVAVGNNKARISGDFGRVGDLLQFAVDASDLALLDAKLGGVLHASGRVGGTWKEPSLSFIANGTALHYASAYSAATFSATGDVAASAAPLAQRALTLNLATTSLHVDNVVLSDATLRMTGTVAQHEATIAAKGTAANTGMEVTARLNGGWSGDAATGGWSGKIVALEGRGSYPFMLTNAATLEASAKRVHVAALHGTLAGGTFAVEDLRWEAGRLSSNGNFAAMPVGPWLALTDAATRISSTLVLSGHWSFVAAPRINGKLAISRDSGDLAARDSPELALRLSRLDATADIVDDRIHAVVTARSAYADADLTGDLGASASQSGKFGQGAPLKLTARVDARSLKSLQALAGTTALIDGRLALDLAGEGTLDKVRFMGSIDGEGLKIEAPQYGVFLKDGVLHARLAEDAVTVNQLSFTGGSGTFSASGTLPAAVDGNGEGSRLTWKAEKLALFDRPDTRLVLSGSGTLSIQQKAVTLAGSITADQGHFEFRPAPPDTLGADVVVQGRGRASTEAARQRVPFDVDLELDFGRNFTFVGEGFDSRLAGKVRVKTTANRELAGFGTIRAINGTYTAFGQRLAIDRGQLYFNGPLDNPGLDVVALRKNLPVEAGVAVTGTVRVPVVQLTSNPPVADNEKLSWLVLGHGLDTTNSADAAALQAALAALGGVGGQPIGQRIARTFGVDDISFHSADPTKSGSPGGQVVALSKRLTDRLSLVYEQGLSLANNALKIEYSLSRSVTIRASAGAVSGFGIYYSRSFD